MSFFGTTEANGLLMSLLGTVLAFVLVSCDGLINSSGGGSGNYDEPLEITGVRYQHADSVDEQGNPLRPDTIGPGMRLAIEGRNMNAVANVYFLGYEADFYPAIASEEYLIASVPSDLPFGDLSAAELDTLDPIRVENDAHEAIYEEVPVLPSRPELESMSNEYVQPGREATLSGQFLYLVEGIDLPDGTTISPENIEAADDGSAARFTVPTSATTMSGPLTMRTAAGSDDSSPAFMFHDSRNTLLNMDERTDWAGWNALLSTSSENQELISEFRPGADGEFMIMRGEGSISGGGNNEWYTDNRVINLSNQQWVPPENLDEPPSNFAVKFELNIRQEWAAGSILIYLIETATDNYETGYAYRVKPWEQPDGSVSAVSWEGWRTITVPFNQFRDSYGSSDGATASSLTTLLGEDGAVAQGGPDDNPTSFRLINYSEGTIPEGQAFAIDNIRVVRIAESN